VVGTLNTLCPGVGYVIRLANASTLSYEQVRGSEGMENIQLSEKVESPIGIQPNSNMLYSMTVVAKLALDNDALLVSEKDMVYAYINGEVSGMMHPSQGEEGLIFLSIGSNFESSEEITFKLWLDGQQQLLPLHESLTYEPFAAIGEPSSPFYLTLKDMAGQEEQSNGFWIGEPYPNPFKGQTTVPYYLNEGSEISYKIYDSRGVQVVPAKSITATKGHQHFTIESVGLAQGVYLLEVTLSNHSKMIRLVIN